MSTVNTKSKSPVYLGGKPTFTYEGAPATIPADKELLRRLVLSCFLWEKNFYIDGVSVAEQISEVAQRIAQSDPEFVRQLAVSARTVHNLRSVPLWVTVALAKAGKLKADVVEAVVKRPDEMGELLAQYWKLNGRESVAVAPKKISKQLQKGLAKAFTHFDEYQLAKWNRDKDISIKNVLELVHPTPTSSEQSDLWKRLLEGNLKTPDTWEVGLSAGDGKKETFTRLLKENKLGYQALLMNLRNMREAGVSEELVFNALLNGAGRSKTLPFQFITAARHNPQWESVIEKAMFASLAGLEKLPGTTVLLVDISGSMEGKLSEKSELTRLDAAAGLAMLLREVCENVKVFKYDDKTDVVPDRRGFALRAAIGNTRGGTRLGQALDYVEKAVPNADRVIVFTDEQSHDKVKATPPAKAGYIMNIAPYAQGVGYFYSVKAAKDEDYGVKFAGRWTHINGFSDALVKFVHELESGV